MSHVAWFCRTFRLLFRRTSSWRNSTKKELRALVLFYSDKRDFLKHDRAGEAWVSSVLLEETCLFVILQSQQMIWSSYLCVVTSLEAQDAGTHGGTHCNIFFLLSAVYSFKTCLNVSTASVCEESLFIRRFSDVSRSRSSVFLLLPLSFFWKNGREKRGKRKN